MEALMDTLIVNNEPMTLQTIKALLENGILTITINRPDKLNALNHQTLDDLRILMEDVYHNPEIKGVIITGEGQKAFVAGADISEFSNYNTNEGYKMADFGCKIFKSVEICPKPVIAAINGFALGGGCELAMACHMRLATENAKFGQPEVNLGLTPGYAGTQRLTELIGKGKAMELLLTGDMINAQEAYRLGLVNHVLATQEELIAKAKEILTKIMAKSPVAVKAVIDCVDAFYTDGVDGFEFEKKAFASCFGTQDFNEGVSAFLEKRKPNFPGK